MKKNRQMIASALLLFLLINPALCHFGFGGPPPPKGGPPKMPPKPPMPDGPGKGWFDWFKGGFAGPKCKEDAKELGVTQPPFSPPPPMPLVDFLAFTPPPGPMFNIEVIGGKVPPSLANFDKGKCVCELFKNVVQSSVQLDVSELMVQMKATPKKPNPTLFDSCVQKIKAVPELNKPPVKLLMNCVGQQDLVGLKSCHDEVLQGKVETVKDLVLNLKENSPGAYQVVVSLILNLQIDFNATINLLGDKTASLISMFIMELKAGTDINLIIQKCSDVKDKGALIELIAAIRSAYPTLVDSLVLGPPFPFSPPPSPPPTTPTTPTTPSTPSTPSSPPPSPPPFPVGLPSAIVKILLDVQAKCKSQSELKSLLAQLDLDFDANLTVIIQKIKSQFPDLVAKMLVQINESDIDGLIDLLKEIMSGKISGSAQLVAQFQSKCPGIFQFLISIVSKIKLTFNALWESLESSQQQLLIKLKIQIVESFTKIHLKLEGSIQKLLDALKKAIPGLEIILNVKVDVKGSLSGLLDAILTKIPDPSAMQKVIDSLPSADPAKLDSLVVKIKINLPAIFKIVIGQLKVADLDGLSVVISDAVSNKFNSIEQLTLELKTKCPGFIEFLLWLLGRIKIFWNDFEDGLDQPLKELLKLIVQLLLELIEKLLVIIKGADPNDIGKIIDGIITAIPPSEPIMNAIKLYITITIRIEIETSIFTRPSPPPGLPPGVTPPSPPSPPPGFPSPSPPNGSSPAPPPGPPPPPPPPNGSSPAPPPGPPPPPPPPNGSSPAPPPGPPPPPPPPNGSSPAPPPGPPPPPPPPNGSSPTPPPGPPPPPPSDPAPTQPSNDPTDPNPGNPSPPAPTTPPPAPTPAPPAPTPAPPAPTPPPPAPTPAPPSPTPAPTTQAPPPTTTTACPAGGVWGPWSTPSACTDICGKCGTQSSTRVCQSSAKGCPCTGPTSKTEPCGLVPCKYPRNSCCQGKAMAINGNLYCN